MNQYLSMLSWRHWGIIRYNSFWQNISGAFYLILADRLLSWASIGRVFLLILLTTVLTAYGYLINDFCDIELDRKHGKANAFQGISRARAAVVVLFLLVLQLLVSLPFLDNPWYMVIWLAQALAASFYSLPPIRMKERGLPGLVTTIIAQQTLATALVFAAFGRLDSLGALIFVLFSTVRGISSDVGHQLRDRARDASTHTATFAVRQGQHQIQVIYAISLELERLVLGGVMLLLLVRLPHIQLPFANWTVSPAWPLMGLYAVLIPLTLGRSWQAFRQDRLLLEDPYDEVRQAQKKDALYIIHHPLPSVLTPLYLAAWATLLYWPNGIFLLVLGLRYGLFSVRRWKSLVHPLLAQKTS